jgi:RNA recognition motif-containing protein
VVKTKTLRPSDVRLKVRNIDEKQVTNDDLKKLFAKIGELKVCRFDRNEFGQFLGSATVTYERPECARNAIESYNGAFLDDKVLTVEYDMVRQNTKVVRPASSTANTNPASARSGGGPQPRKGTPGKTLRVNKN